MQDARSKICIRSAVVTALVLAVAFLGYGISAPWAFVTNDGEAAMVHAVGGTTVLGLVEIAGLLVIALFAVARTDPPPREGALLCAIGGVVGLIVIRLAHVRGDLTHAPALARVGFALATIACVVLAAPSRSRV